MGDLKVYGNQHGTFIRIEGQTLERVRLASHLMGITVEEFIIRAIEEKALMTMVGTTVG